MKTIGLLGGMSWESSLEYYRLINQAAKAKLGGLHSAKCLMFSVDFHEIEILQHQEKWDELTEIMIEGAKRVERGGADLLVICTNTMHKMADAVQSAISIPVLHIADAAAGEILEQKLRIVGLLGTRFTMEQDFYKGRLSQKFGLKVLIPRDSDREIVHKVIYNELCLGKTLDSSRKEFVRIIDTLVQQGAEGIVLGCTEIPLLVKSGDVAVPVFDTTAIHARHAVDVAVGG
jgi:aspartate racemase